MADDTEQPDVYPGDASGHLHPALIDFRQRFTNAEGAEWAKGVADKIQTYATQKAILGDAQRQSDAYLVNAHNTQRQLVQMVQGDPHAGDLAISLAGDAAQALASHHPPGEDRDQAVKALGGQFRNQVAHATVQSLAAIDPDAARAAIGRYGDHLTAGEAGSLSQYVDGMSRVRLLDQRSAAINGARQMLEQANSTTAGYLGQMVHPDTGVVQYPPDFGKRMMLDPRMAPEQKASLLQAYDRLQTNGDRPSDPAVLTAFLERAANAPNTPDHPMPHQVIDHVGQDLSAADAQWLTTRVGPQGAPMQNETQAIVDALGQAREFVGTGRGSDNAYGRFVNWFLPTYQKYTAAGMPGSDLLDPNSSSYLLNEERMAGFKPGGMDIIKGLTGFPTATPETRQSLHNIFSGQVDADTMRFYRTGDPVLDPDFKSPARRVEENRLPGDTIDQLVGDSKEALGGTDQVIAPQHDPFYPQSDYVKPSVHGKDFDNPDIHFEQKM